MKKHFLLIILLAFAAINVSAQKKYAVYGVGFYNQENLFDTQHDEGKNDYDFLPDGSYKWNELKYNHKLHNMARALADMGTDMLPNGCAIIGLSEVENANALTDLCAQPELAARGYKFAHIEGPDRRGVDCALLYNPSLFTIKDVKLVPYIPELEKDSTFKTRGFLTVRGYLAGEPVAVIVCHWPSRFSGSFYRECAGRQVKVVKDALLEENPNIKVMVMGDMNDDPQNKSMSVELSAKGKMKDVREGDMFNPWWAVLESGTGTLSYQGSWNLFDQIVMTPNMLDLKGTKDYSKLTYLKCQIQRFDYLLQSEGKYKGTPKRTTAGGEWLDGFSDHLPVAVYLVKEADRVTEDMKLVPKDLYDISDVERKLDNILKKARAESETWTDDEWRDQCKNIMKTLQPVLLKMENLSKRMENIDSNDHAMMEEVSTMTAQLDNVSKYMVEFSELAGQSEIGSVVWEDDDFWTSVAKDLGIDPEFFKAEEAQPFDEVSEP